MVDIGGRKFYELQDPLLSGAPRGRSAGPETYSFLEAAHLGQMAEQREVIIHQDMGWRPMDFIWVSLIPIIHQRIVDALSAAGATGWATYPVEVYDKKGKRLPGYHGLSITGRCDSMFLDAEHSELVQVELPRGIGFRYRGLCFTKDSWDGSDLFTSRDRRTRTYIVTQKVFDAFAQAKVASVDLIPIEDVERNATDQPFVPFAQG